jgi:2-phosphoglycerate kinase
MIILIGGSSCTGKTKIAYELMKRIEIPYLSIDILMMGIFRSSSNCGFTPMSDSIEVSNSLWPIILQMMKTNIENGTSYIYEGFQILPKNILDIDKDYMEKTKAYFIGFSDNYIENHYESIKDKRSIIENRSDIDSKSIMKRNNIELKRQCEIYKQKLFQFEDEYFNEREKTMNQIENSISNS